MLSLCKRHSESFLCIGGFGMYLWLYANTVNSITKGYYGKDRVFDNKTFCVLDTDDMVVEFYTLEEFEKLRKYVDIKPAKYKYSDIQWAYHFLGEKISVHDGGDFGTTCLMFNGDVVFKMVYCVCSDDVTKRLCFRRGRKEIFSIYSMSGDKASMSLLWGHKLGDCYRILVLVLIIDSSLGQTSEGLIISSIFSESEFLGIEYVYGGSNGDYDFDRSFYPKGVVGAKLAMLH